MPFFAQNPGPAGYHLVVEDDSAEKIFNRLEELYKKSG